MLRNCAKSQAEVLLCIKNKYWSRIFPGKYRVARQLLLASDAGVEVKEALCGIKKDKIRFGVVPILSGWDSPIIDILDCNLLRSVFCMRDRT